MMSSFAYYWDRHSGMGSGAGKRFASLFHVIRLWLLDVDFDSVGWTNTYYQLLLHIFQTERHEFALALASLCFARTSLGVVALSWNPL